MSRTSFLVIAVLSAGCGGSTLNEAASVTPLPAEREFIESALTDSLFGAISRFDYAGVRRSATPEFELVEDTVRLTMDGFIEVLRSFEGKATINYRFTGFNTRVAGNTAWTTYRNNGDMSLQGKRVNYEWLETAVLVRRGGVWRIDRLQSTVVRPRQ